MINICLNLVNINLALKVKNLILGSSNYIIFLDFVVFDKKLIFMNYVLIISIIPNLSISSLLTQNLLISLSFLPLDAILIILLLPINKNLIILYLLVDVNLIKESLIVIFNIEKSGTTIWLKSWINY